MPMILNGRYCTVTEICEKQGITTGYLRNLLGAGRVVGAVRVAKTWLIPLPFTVISSGSNMGPKSKLKMKDSA